MKVNVGDGNKEDRADTARKSSDDDSTGYTTTQCWPYCTNLWNLLLSIHQKSIMMLKKVACHPNYARTHTHTSTHTHTHTLSHTHIHTYTLTHTLPKVHTHALSLSLSIAHTDMMIHT